MLCYSPFFFISSPGARAPRLPTSAHYVSVTSMASGSGRTDFWTAGQMCLHVDCRISKADVRDQWLGQMTIARGSLRIGHPIKADMNQTVTG